MGNKAITLHGSEVSPEVAEFYKNNAAIGTQNLSGGKMPQLKITESNSKNEGEDGQYLPEGEFYYAPTKTAYKELEVSILTISKGFYAMDNQEDPKPKFTQLVGGMLLNSTEPFVMFMGGTRLQNLWDFGNEIRPLTKHKEQPVSMLGMRVMLDLEKIETKYGKNHVVNFNLIRNDKKQIQMINDVELLNMLRGGVEKLEDMFESFIHTKEVDRNSGQLINRTMEEEAREAFDMDDPSTPR